MSVRDQDPRDAPGADGGDGLDVRLVGGPGIDDGKLVRAHEVGVRSRAGQRTRIGGDDPDDARPDRLRPAGREVSAQRVGSGDESRL